MVEVTIAIGIVAFAFIAIFGLLPVGMTTFRQAMDTNVGSQIAQQAINDAQQSDFDQLIKDASGTTITGTNNTGRKAVRYFDDQGKELVAAQVNQAIYHVNTRITPATAFPKTGTAGTDNPNVATVTIQIANNPGNLPLAYDPGTSSDQSSPLRNLWTGATTANPTNTGVVPLMTYVAVVAKNK